MICNCLSVACAKRRIILSNIMYSSLFRTCNSNPKSSIIIIVQLFDICKPCVKISLDLDISSALYMVTTESAKVGHVKYANFEEVENVIPKELNRLIELDNLYIKLQSVSGYTVEQLIDLFMQGYILQRLEEDA